MRSVQRREQSMRIMVRGARGLHRSLLTSQVGIEVSSGKGVMCVRLAHSHAVSSIMDSMFKTGSYRLTGSKSNQGHGLTTKVSPLWGSQAAPPFSPFQRTLLPKMFNM